MSDLLGERRRKEQKKVEGLGFLVKKRRIDFIDEPHASECPPGGFGFQVEIRSFSSSMIERALQLAEKETERVGFKCGSGFNTRGEDAFNLAHALEHLVVVDLQTRGVLNLPTGTVAEIAARTTTTPELTLFWIRKGLTTPEEELTSVKAAIEKVNGLLKEVS